MIINTEYLLCPNREDSACSGAGTYDYRSLPMANVFTKRSKIPRTTTLGDYGMRSGAARHFKDQHRTSAEENHNRFLHSPTRRQNPQPAGLVYQSPYNRFSNVSVNRYDFVYEYFIAYLTHMSSSELQVFGIWDVNPMIPAIRCEKTIPHICKYMLYFVASMKLRI